MQVQKHFNVTTLNQIFKQVTKRCSKWIITLSMSVNSSSSSVPLAPPIFSLTYCAKQITWLSDNNLSSAKVEKRITAQNT